MHKFIKDALLASGGFVLGTVALTAYALNNKEIRTCLASSLADKITNVLYGEETISRRRYNRPFSYKQYSIQHTLDDIAFDTRNDAERVLEEATDICNKYGFVTLSDICDLTDVETNYMADKYGWVSTKQMHVSRFRYGYKIVAPAPLPLS